MIVNATPAVSEVALAKIRRFCRVVPVQQAVKGKK